MDLPVVGEMPLSPNCCDKFKEQLNLLKSSVHEAIDILYLLSTPLPPPLSPDKKFWKFHLHSPHSTVQHASEVED
jgi:hypothetical protein